MRGVARRREWKCILCWNYIQLQVQQVQLQVAEAGCSRARVLDPLSTCAAAGLLVPTRVQRTDYGTIYRDSLSCVL